MDDQKPILIFKTGTHTDMSGQTRSFTAADLQAIAAAYDPASHEAPLVVGHPQHDAPAYGWVAGLTADGDRLYALPKQLDAGFREMVNAGRFKHVSASFYLPEASSNPKKGGYYLRHVGFLGAAAPAVKGLGKVSFALEKEEFIEFHAPSTKEKTMPEETLAAEAALKEQEARLAALTRQLDERQQKLDLAEVQQLQRANSEFVEGLIKSGKLLPVHKEKTVALLGAVSGVAAMEFAEEGKTVKSAPAQTLRDLLAAMPVQVDFVERAGKESAPQGVVSFHAPAGYAVDPERLALHHKALAFAQANNTDYLAAVMAVGQQ